MILKWQIMSVFSISRWLPGTIRVCCRKISNLESLTRPPVQKTIIDEKN